MENKELKLMTDLDFVTVIEELHNHTGSLSLPELHNLAHNATQTDGCNINAAALGNRVSDFLLERIRFTPDIWLALFEHVYDGSYDLSIQNHLAMGGNLAVVDIGIDTAEEIKMLLVEIALKPVHEKRTKDNTIRKNKRYN